MFLSFLLSFARSYETKDSLDIQKKDISKAPQRKAWRPSLEPLATPDCTVCDNIMAFVLDHGPGFTASSIGTLFREECERTPHVQSCHLFTDENVGRIIEHIAKSLSSFEVCTFFAQC